MVARSRREGPALLIHPAHFDRERVPGEARGIVDSVAAYGVDPARIHPAIAAFFEDTASLELVIRSRWRWPFSWLWWLGRRVMRRIGQFVYPVHEGRIRTRVFPLARGRAVIRSYDDGGPMQVVRYDVVDDNMRAWFPLPGGGVRGVLAMVVDDTGGVTMTSKPRGAGVWLVLGPLAIRAPLGESLSLWAAGTDAVPVELRGDPLGDATLVGRHTQRLFGIRFVTHHYWFRPG